MLSRAAIVLLLSSLLGCADPAHQSSATLPAGAPARPSAGESPDVAATAVDVDRIERTLKIELPPEYRRFVAARAEELKGYTYPLRGKSESWIESDFFDFDTQRIIGANTSQRAADMAAGNAFPRWWKEYFLFGTNGGGDYYALRLDGKPGVWFLACDAGEIRLQADSLEQFADQAIADYKRQAPTYDQLETLWQRKNRGEIDEAEFDKQWQAILAAEE